MLIPPSVGSSLRSMKFSTRHARISRLLRLDEGVFMQRRACRMLKKGRRGKRRKKRKEWVCVSACSSSARNTSPRSFFVFLTMQWRTTRPMQPTLKEKMQSSDCCRFGEQTIDKALRVWRWDLYVYDSQSKGNDQWLSTFIKKIHLLLN